jgi:hypothetical protein
LTQPEKKENCRAKRGAKSRKRGGVKRRAKSRKRGRHKRSQIGNGKNDVKFR